MIPVKQSELARFFDDIPPDAEELAGLCLLEPDEATLIFRRYVASAGKGLYQVPDDSWIPRAQWHAVGNWIDAFNEKAPASAVVDVVTKLSSWKTSEPLLLIQSARDVVSLTFAQFGRYWVPLLMAFDDGPLLLSSDVDSKVAFRFVPLGTILYAKRDCETFVKEA